MQSSPESYAIYFTHPELIFPRLALITARLSSLHKEMAMMLAQEHRAKHRGFSMSEESTVAGRNRAADYEAIELTSTIFELRGETKAYELEYEYLVLLIKQGELNPYGIDIDGSEIRTLDAVGSQEAGSLTS